MDANPPNWTLGKLAEALGGRFDGPADMPIHRPAPADSDDPNAIAFAGSKAFLEVLEASGVGAALVSADLIPKHKPHIVVQNPRAAFGKVLALFVRPLPLNPGIHSLASVDPSATVSPTAQIGPYAVVEREAVVGPGVRIYPFAYIGEACEIGEGSVVYPNAVLYQSVKVGKRCIVHSGAVLGADGFGFVWDGTRRIKIPQVGQVVVEDEVEIGSNTAIDRATAGVTRIGKGTKLDNLVQVGHNVSIGEDSVIASQAGVSGSTVLGNRLTVAGQVAFSDHITVCDDVTLGGRSGVIQNIDEPGEYLGFPARPLGEAMRAMALASKLPDLVGRLRRLEARVKELEG